MEKLNGAGVVEVIVKTGNGCTLPYYIDAAIWGNRPRCAFYQQLRLGAIPYIYTFLFPSISKEKIMEYIHKTKNGELIPLSKMTNSHLLATVRMLIKKATEGLLVKNGGGDGPDSFWYEEKIVTGHQALYALNFHYYVAELESRGLNSPKPIFS